MRVCGGVDGARTKDRIQLSGIEDGIGQVL